MQQLSRAQRGLASRASASLSSAESLSSSPKRVVITGGNTGIGFETAKVLCQKSYDVTIACRDAGKAARAVAAIKAAQPSARIDSLQLDLADLSSVRDAASRWLDAGKQADVLLNNAGVMACPRMTTADGFELQLGVNHLGHFLWTSLLLPRLQENPNPVRIINVASTAHLFGRMDFDDLMSERDYDRWRAYGQSKLANILFTYELAKRLQPGSNITANCLHPGVVRTELPRYLITDPDSLSAKVLTLLLTPFTLSPEEGARTSIYLASSPDVEGVNSKYYDSCKPATSSAASYDAAAAAKLWQVSEELTRAQSSSSSSGAAAAAAVAAGAATQQ